LARFPKQRSALSPAHRARYLTDYLENRQGKQGVAVIVAFLEAWMHRRIARAGQGSRILEIGAGTLNHLPYEPEHARYDVVEPFRELWEDRPARFCVHRIYHDIREIPAGDLYDRIISIAVYEHLLDLPYHIARSGLLLAPGGTMAAAIPTEGSLLWGLAWQYGTGTAYRLRTGLDYAVLMRHEHVNNAREIETLIRHFYARVSVKRFPLPLFHASLYSVIAAQSPKTEACREYIERAGSPDEVAAH
jgi:hypothetical protein